MNLGGQNGGFDLRDAHPASYARLRWASEEAKKKLSSEPYVRVREESLATIDGQPCHLDVEISRDEYEQMIRPLVESTLEGVAKVMDDAGKTSSDISAVLLVGGSTRTPLIWEVLEERVGTRPRQDIHPDLGVARGSAVLGSRLGGFDVERVLVDVSPFSFGPSYLAQRDGRPYPYCYRPIIERNTPLPVTRTESYETAYPYQTKVQVEIFQGDEPDALKNLLVGQIRVEELSTQEEPNEVLCRMNLDLDGILKVTAIEKSTGKSKHITINHALELKSDAEMAAAQQRLKDLFAWREVGLEEVVATSTRPLAASMDADQELAVTTEVSPAIQQARRLLERSRAILNDVHDEDREEIMVLHERIEQAIKQQDDQALSSSTESLRERLFFVEGS